MSKLRTRGHSGQRMRAAGYVLVEVIASLVIFSIGMVAVMRAFSVTIQARALAQDYTIANLLCQKLLSEIRAMPRSTGGGQSKGTFGEAYPGFQWELTVVTERLLTPQEQEEPQPQPRKRKGRRTKGSEKSKDELSAALEKQMELREATVTISWKRRGASYDVSATALVPEQVAPTQDREPGRAGKQGSEGVGRESVLDRGRFRMDIGARRNVGT